MGALSLSPAGTMETWLVERLQEIERLATAANRAGCVKRATWLRDRTPDEEKRNLLRKRFGEKMEKIDDHVRRRLRIGDMELLPGHVWEAEPPAYGSDS